MRKTVIASIAVLAGYLIGPGSDAMAAPPQKLTDLKCTAGQTVAFDGALWVCADFPGLTGLERKVAHFPPDDGSLSTIATQGVEAECSPGKKVVGGGYMFFFGGPTVPIRTNVPDITLGKWIVSATNLDGTSWRLSAIAICADAE